MSCPHVASSLCLSLFCLSVSFLSLYFFLSFFTFLGGSKVVPRHDGSPHGWSIKSQASDGWGDKPLKWGHSALANFILLVSVSKQAGQCSPLGSFYLATCKHPQYCAIFKHITPSATIDCCVCLCVCTCHTTDVRPLGETLHLLYHGGRTHAPCAR